MPCRGFPCRHVCKRETVRDDACESAAATLVLPPLRPHITRCVLHSREPHGRPASPGHHGTVHHGAVHHGAVHHGAVHHAVVEQRDLLPNFREYQIRLKSSKRWGPDGCSDAAARATRSPAASLASGVHHKRCASTCDLFSTHASEIAVGIRRPCASHETCARSWP